MHSGKFKFIYLIKKINRTTRTAGRKVMPGIKGQVLNIVI